MTKVLEEVFELSNGVKIPKLGLGVWMIPDELTAQAVKTAVEIGYRHIDTAQACGNEHGVGEGVKICGIQRDELFVTTKLAAEIKDYKKAAEAIDRSLMTAGLDYYDLMLIHSPQPWKDFRGGDYSEGNLEAWRALEDAMKAGKLRSIGVANFKENDIENIINNGMSKPLVNQILCHIGNTPTKLIDYCKHSQILVESYSPIANGVIVNHPQIKTIANKYGVSAAQLCVRYDLQLGTLPLPKSADPAHIKENSDIDFVISDEDMETLKGFEIKDYGEFSRFPVFSGK